MKIFFPLTFDLYRHWRGGYNLITNVLRALSEQAKCEILYVYTNISEQPEWNSFATINYFAEPETVLTYLREVKEFEKEKQILISLGHCGLWQSPISRVIYIPDFQHQYYPNFFSSSELSARKLGYQVECTTADGVWMSSRSVQADLQRFIINAPKKQLTLPFSSLKKLPNEIITDPPLVTGKYFLCVSQDWPHKNIQKLIKSWERISSSDRLDWQLIVVSQNISLEMITHSQCKIYRDADESLLWNLYKNASAFILPSLFEGWSTPVEEAIQCQIPLILSDIAVLREQAPFGSLFFNPSSEDSICAALDSVIKDPNLLHHLKQEVGKNNRDSPKEYAQKLYRFFEEVLE